MAHRAFNANHFHLAAQLLKSWEVDANLVNQVLVRTKELAERFVIGNFVALTGFCRNRMTAPAIRLLLTSLDAMDPLARHVGLTLMGSRALAGDPDDVAAPHLRNMLHQAFDRLLAHDEATTIPAATLSMAWCYMSAFAGKYDLKPPPEAYPALNPTVAEEVLPWVCDPSRLIEEPSAQFRSLQLAYLEELKQIPEKTEQGITAMHYLWFLSVGYANLVNIPEVSETLPALLASDSKIANFVASIDFTPELRLVFEACQTVANVR